MAETVSDKPKIVIVVGPTASGKSELAVRIAEQFGGEVVNADSMQVYRGMDVGTAKPGADLLRRVQHHLLDVADPDEAYSAARFEREASAVIEDISARGKLPVIVGGTGLYIRALTGGLAEIPSGEGEVRRRLEERAQVEGLPVLYEYLHEVDPATAQRLHPNDAVRIIRALEVYELTGQTISAAREVHRFSERRYRTLKVGLSVPREELYRRIDARVDLMMENGFEEEVSRLLKKGFHRDLNSMKSLGYRHVASHLAGEIPLAEAVELMKRDTRRYAKRQLTWFNKEPDINWFDSSGNSVTIFSCVMEFLKEGEGNGESTVQYPGPVP